MFVLAYPTVHSNPQYKVTFSLEFLAVCCKVAKN